MLMAYATPNAVPMCHEHAAALSPLDRMHSEGDSNVKHTARRSRHDTGLGCSIIVRRPPPAAVAAAAIELKFATAPTVVLHSI